MFQTAAGLTKHARGATKAALAMRTSIGQSRILEVLHRFENRYNRNATSAFRLLAELRSGQPNKTKPEETSS